MLSIDIAIPVYWRTDEQEFRKTVSALDRVCRTRLAEYDWMIIAAINGPNEERMLKLTEEVAKSFPKLRASHAPAQGKGAGILQAWRQSRADFRIYTDVDLSADLECLPEILNRLQGGCDVCIASRRHPESVVKRSTYRAFVSWVYHRIFFRPFLRTRIRDAQCGLKGMTARAANAVLPHVQDDRWFFDSEILVLSERMGFKVVEVPVRWNEAPTSHLRMNTAIPNFLSGLWRMMRTPTPKREDGKP